MAGEAADCWGGWGNLPGAARHPAEHLLLMPRRRKIDFAAGEALAQSHAHVAMRAMVEIAEDRQAPAATRLAAAVAIWQAAFGRPALITREAAAPPSPRLEEDIARAEAAAAEVEELAGWAATPPADWPAGLRVAGAPQR